jgi:hypothetical protein
MARLIKEDAVQGESAKEAARKPPIRTHVFEEKDLMQIIATVSSTPKVLLLKCFYFLSFFIKQFDFASSFRT